MTTIFKSIKWKNLLSTGNVWTEVDLTRSPTTLIVGKNGSGKSTILDALTFCYFGKPFRNINKPTLINSINNRDMVVEGVFSIGQKEYRVVRGIKPNIFEIYCNGQLLNQDAKAKDYQDILEKTLLKMNFKSFTQIVILGAASFTPFMQLKAADRREIIEDLLDIQIFSLMNVVARQKLSEIKVSLDQAQVEMEKLDIRIASINQMITEIKQNNQNKIEQNEAEIAANLEACDEIQKVIDELEAEIESREKDLQKELSVREKIEQMEVLEVKIKSNLRRYQNELQFYTSNDNCPTCHQNLDMSFKDSMVKTRNEKIVEIETGVAELNSKLSALRDRWNKAQSILTEITDGRNEIKIKRNTIDSIQKYNDKLKKENVNLSKKNKITTDFDRDLKNFEQEKLNYMETIKRDEENRYYYELSLSLLKDNGIKTKIVKQYIPIINKLINKYLTAMDFFVNFNLNENFEESIKSRHRDDFAYENFSEGEKQKIDLALLFTWRAVAKMKNSVSTNILLLDEVFDSSLDSNATEELLKILSALGSDTNLFVISHREDLLFDKFRSSIKFEKVNDFSRIVGG